MHHHQQSYKLPRAYGVTLQALTNRLFYSRRHNTLLASLLLAGWQARHQGWQHVLPVTTTTPSTAAITDQLHINTLAGLLHLCSDACGAG
jgi:hypothetical protein